CCNLIGFFFSSRRRHTRFSRDWSSDVCSSDLIFTRDLRRVMRAYEALDVGTVVVNHTTAVRVETMPFGGNKGSGNGREGIHDTLHEMSKEKTLLLHEVFGAAV